MAMFVRVAVAAFPGIVPQWQQILVFVAIASMVLGAFAAIGQRNIKRLMAYSSIGHMGFALVGLAAGTAEGVQGVLIYMAIYLAMTLGTFACILSMRRGDGMVEEISDLAGLARTKPAMAFFLAVLLFSLAGIPPLAGFFAKFYVFLAAIKAGLFTLAVIGVLASVVGAYYYLRIVKIMYFDEPAESFEPMPGELKAVLGVTGLFNLLFFVYPAPLLERRERGGEVAVLMQLDPSAAAAGVAARHPRHDRLDQRRGAGAARARGERGPLWIAARSQTAGRGRRGRAWVSEPGNLYASLLLTDPAPPERARRTVVRRGAGACTTRSADASRAWRSGSALKWPNDLLIDGSKFAGILIEGEGRRGRRSASASIARTIRPTRPIPATDLAAAGVRATPESLFAALSAAMVRAARAMGPRRGLCRDPRRLARRAPRARRADPRARLPNGERAGRFETHRRARPAGPAPAGRHDAKRSRRATSFRRSAASTA